MKQYTLLFASSSSFNTIGTIQYMACISSNEWREALTCGFNIQDYVLEEKKCYIEYFFPLRLSPLKIIPGSAFNATRTGIIRGLPGFSNKCYHYNGRLHNPQYVNQKFGHEKSYVRYLGYCGYPFKLHTAKRICDT